MTPALLVQVGLAPVGWPLSAQLLLAALSLAGIAVGAFAALRSAP